MRRRFALAAAAAMLVLSPPAEGADVRYRLERVSGGSGALRARYDPAQLALLEKLSRRDLGHLAGAGELLVPDRWDLDELAYAPLPATWAWAVPYGHRRRGSRSTWPSGTSRCPRRPRRHHGDAKIR
jgi:hypothetical protein